MKGAGNYNFSAGKSPFVVTEKTVAAAGTGVIASYGSLSITTTTSAPAGLRCNLHE